MNHLLCVYEMSLREAASDDEDDLQSVSDGKSVFSDSDEEDQGTLAARAAPRSQGRCGRVLAPQAHFVCGRLGTKHRFGLVSSAFC